MTAVAYRPYLSLVSKVTIATAVTVALAVGCTQSDLDTPDSASIRDVVWSPDGWVYYVVAGGSGGIDRLWRTREGEDAEIVPVNAEPYCEEPIRLGALFLSGGEVGLRIACEIDGNEIVVVRESSGVEAIVSLPFVPSTIAQATVALYVDLDTGRYCRRMMQVQGDGQTWLDVAAEADDWSKVRLVPGRSEGRCGDTTAAGLPSISAEGDKLAFAATRDGNTDGGDGLWDEAVLYYGDVDGVATELAVLDRPIDVAVSPDGRYVAASARRHGGGALWLIDAGSGDVAMRATGTYGVIAFSPDSRMIVAVRPNESGTGNVLELIDVDEQEVVT